MSGHYKAKIKKRIYLIFAAATTSSSSGKHVSIQSPPSDIASMSVISGVKHVPNKGSSSKKSEKLPQFGVKTEKEPELSAVSFPSTFAKNRHSLSSIT